MKNTLFAIFSVFILWSCDNNVEPKTEARNNIKITENFDWLIGNWKRNNDEEGKITYETWYKNNNNTYQGFGFAISNGDTISKENMAIAKIDDSWRLEVFTKEDTSKTYFQIIKIDKNSFTFENNEIDFPNKIQYWKDDKKLKATISSSGFKIYFEFDKINK